MDHNNNNGDTASVPDGDGDAQVPNEPIILASIQHSRYSIISYAMRYLERIGDDSVFYVILQCLICLLTVEFLIVAERSNCAEIVHVCILIIIVALQIFVKAVFSGDNRQQSVSELIHIPKGLSLGIIFTAYCKLIHAFYDTYRIIQTQQLDRNYDYDSDDLNPTNADPQTHYRLNMNHFKYTISIAIVFYYNILRCVNDARNTTNYLHELIHCELDLLFSCCMAKLGESFGQVLVDEVSGASLSPTSFVSLVVLSNLLYFAVKSVVVSKFMNIKSRSRYLELMLSVYIASYLFGTYLTMKSEATDHQDFTKSMVDFHTGIALTISITTRLILNSYFMLN